MALANECAVDVEQAWAMIHAASLESKCADIVVATVVEMKVGA